MPNDKEELKPNINIDKTLAYWVGYEVGRAERKMDRERLLYVIDNWTARENADQKATELQLTAVRVRLADAIIKESGKEGKR